MVTELTDDVGVVGNRAAVVEPHGMPPRQRVSFHLFAAESARVLCSYSALSLSLLAAANDASFLSPRPARAV
jgi:hypothetical protein